MALLKDGTRVYGTLFANAGFNSGTINATSNGVVANSTNISLGNSSVNVAITPSTIELGTQFDANSLGLYHTGTINAASFTTSGLRANTTAIAPTSNTILLGNTIGRFVLSANTGDFTGAITSSGGVNPASNSTGTALGSSTARWVLNANSGNFTANIAMNSNYITGLSDPSNAQDAATKAYVDTFQQGLHVHASVAAATTDTLATLSGGSVTYNNGTAGVGATLTLGTALATLDGYTLVNGDRIIVKNEASSAHNGIYVRTSSTVLTRATDSDTGAEVAGGDFVFVTNGTLYNSTGWVQIDEVTTIGTDPIMFVQFSGQGTFTAGQYLYLTGSQFNANATSTSTASVLIARDASQNFAANTATLNSVSTSGFVANTTAIAPTSNTILLGNTIGRFVISANTGDFSGTVTGTVANMSTSVNSALLTVGTSFIANTTQVTISGIPLSANGTTGTAAQVLSSNGTTGSPYWATASAGLAVTDDTTTNASRYVLFTDQTSGTMTSEFVSSTKMYFNPSTGKLNATSFNSLSDVFSKENIKTLDSAISKILMMRGVSFTWKGTDDKSIGLIAQEVEGILPEVVSTSEDGIKSVSYDSIIGLLIEGIKEQQQTIEQMKSSINILLDKINAKGEGK